MSLPPRLWRVALAVYLAALLTATHWPRLVVNPPSGFRLDLFIHTGAFMVLTGLIAFSRLFDSPWASGRNIAISSIAALAIAGFDEITQTIPLFGRVSDPLDYAMDAVGIALGALGLLVLGAAVGRKKD